MSNDVAKKAFEEKLAKPYSPPKHNPGTPPPADIQLQSALDYMAGQMFIMNQQLAKIITLLGEKP